MISLEVTDKPDKNWDNRLLQTFQGTVYQTQECANAAKLLGNEPLFLKFLNNKGKIVGQLMIISHKRFEKKGKLFLVSLFRVAHAQPVLGLGDVRAIGLLIGDDLLVDLHRRLQITHCLLGVDPLFQQFRRRLGNGRGTQRHRRGHHDRKNDVLQHVFSFR